MNQTSKTPDKQTKLALPETEKKPFKPSLYYDIQTLGKVNAFLNPAAPNQTRAERLK